MSGVWSSTPRSGPRSPPQRTPGLLPKPSFGFGQSPRGPSAGITASGVLKRVTGGVVCTLDTLLCQFVSSVPKAQVLQGIPPAGLAMNRVWLPKLTLMLFLKGTSVRPNAGSAGGAVLDRLPVKVAGSLDVGKPTLQMDATFVTFAAALQFAWAAKLDSSNVRAGSCTPALLRAARTSPWLCRLQTTASLRTTGTTVASTVYRARAPSFGGYSDGAVPLRGFGRPGARLTVVHSLSTHHRRERWHAIASSTVSNPCAARCTSVAVGSHVRARVC